MAAHPLIVRSHEHKLKRFFFLSMLLWTTKTLKWVHKHINQIITIFDADAEAKRTKEYWMWREDTMILYSFVYLRRVFVHIYAKPLLDMNSKPGDYVSNK